jgi:hypothetical protein
MELNEHELETLSWIISLSSQVIEDNPHRLMLLVNYYGRVICGTDLNNTGGAHNYNVKKVTSHESLMKVFI